MTNMQKIIDALSATTRRSRSYYHITLGKAIDLLENIPAEWPVRFDWTKQGPADPHSYCGYYEDLAFECSPEIVSVGDFLRLCKDTLGRTFTGYKGGDFVMSADTPLWAAQYGLSGGRPIISIQAANGMTILITKDPEY